MKKNLYFLSLLLGSILLLSCEKNEDPNPIEEVQNGVLVLNQGNFSEQSGSLSLYIEETKTCINQFYESANNNISLGAVVMTGAVDKNNVAYLLCSNPDKIVRIDAGTGKLLGVPVTQGLANPRNLIVDEQYIYVTNSGYEYTVVDEWFYEYTHSYVAVYDKNSGNHLKDIPVGSDAEGLCIFNGQLLVAMKEGVKVFELSSGQFLRSIVSQSFYGAAKHLVLDKDGRLWVSYPGEGLMAVNSGFSAEARTINVNLDYEGFIVINDTKDQVYTFISLYDENWAPQGSEVLAINLSNGQQSSVIRGQQFYSLGVNPYTGNIYTSEVNGFSTNSTLMVLKNDGTLLHSTAVGVAAARFLFFQNEQ
jgi:hypothetical protein